MQKFEFEIMISFHEGILKGSLLLPAKFDFIVIFSHASSKGRSNKKHLLIANILNEKKIGALLFDFITPEEEKKFTNNIDLDLITERLIEVTKWIRNQKQFSKYRFAYFAEREGTASAIRASIQLPEILAIVSNDGRPELAMEFLSKLSVPILLMVNSDDLNMVKANQNAFEIFTTDKKITLMNRNAEIEHAQVSKDLISITEGWFMAHMHPLEIFND